MRGDLIEQKPFYLLFAIVLTAGLILSAVLSRTNAAEYTGPMPCNAGYEGVIIFNSARANMQYCNSTSWVSMGSPEAEAAPTTGLVAYWALDDINTTAIDSVGGYNGTMQSGLDGAANSVPGKLSNAISFDGSDDYISVADNAALEPTAPLTVALWIKTNTTTASVLVEKDGDAGYSAQILANGKVKLNVGTAATFLSSNTAVNDDEWHHVIFVYNGLNSGVVYIDGVADTDQSNPSTLVYGAGELNIGGRTTTMNFDGELDDIRLYDAALTADEALQLYSATGGGGVIGSGVCSNPAGVPGEMDYNQDQGILQYCNGKSWVAAGPKVDGAETQTASTTNLVGHWTLDQTTGDTITDTGSGGNDGTWTDTVNDDVGEETTAGQIGTALTFGGTNTRVTLGTPAALGPTTNFTFSAWVNTSSSGSFQAIYSAGSTNADYWAVQLNATNRILLRNDNGPVFHTSSSAISTGSYQHIAVVKSGDVGANVTFYINGVADGTATVGALSNSGTKGIGFRTENNSDYFIGEIDDVRLYDRALSAAEILEIYRAGGGGGYGVCTQPAGTPGEIVYNDDQNVMQFCTPIGWVTTNSE